MTTVVRLGGGETEVVARSAMPVSAQALFDWHERPGAFERLTPSWMPARPEKAGRPFMRNWPRWTP